MSVSSASRISVENLDQGQKSESARRKIKKEPVEKPEEGPRVAFTVPSLRSAAFLEWRKALRVDDVKQLIVKVGAMVDPPPERADCFQA